MWPTSIGHFRVNPTAPLESITPASPLNQFLNAPKEFVVATRLSIGATNSFTWKIEGPGFPIPTVVGTNDP